MSFLWHRKFISFGAFPLKTERLAWTLLAKTCSMEHTKEQSVMEINEPLPCTRAEVFLQPGSHALAGTSPGTYICQPTGHNPEAAQRRLEAAVPGNKVQWMQRQASEIPWKVPLMSDEPITKVLKRFWEVADPTTGPSQEIASLLGKRVLLPLALSACGFMSPPSFPGQIMTPRQQVRRGVSPCQLVPWINQLPSTQSVNLNCLRQETPTELIPLTSGGEVGIATTQTRTANPPCTNRQCRCLSPSHKSQLQIIPYFKAVSMHLAWESTGIFVMFMSTAFLWPFWLSDRLWSTCLGTWTRTVTSRIFTE